MFTEDILRDKVDSLLSTGATCFRLPNLVIGDKVREFICVGILVFVRDMFEGVCDGVYVEYDGVRVMDISNNFWYYLEGLVERFELVVRDSFGIYINSI